MHLARIYLTNFRNFDKIDAKVSPFLTLILGENAKGKTSLLEGIYTSITGTGYRESREQELIKTETDRSIVESHFVEEDNKSIFQMVLLKIGEKRVSKKYYVNKTVKSSNHYKEAQTKAVLFAPEQIRIIDGSPSTRRIYFDTILSEYDRTYAKHLRNYENALRRRNKILEIQYDSARLAAELAFWNAYLVEHGDGLTTSRKKYVEYLNNNSQIDGTRFSIEYKPNAFTMSRLLASAHAERRIRKTQIGPQKDEFTITLHKKTSYNVHFYGSRSEQRLAVLWLKINEIRYYEEVLKRIPILLLDDIFSELDGKNKELVMRVIKKYQTVITSTEEEIGELSDLPEVVIKL